MRWLAGLSYGRTIRDSRLWVCVSRIGSDGPARVSPELVELPVAALPYLRSGFVWKNHAPTEDLQTKCRRAELSSLCIPPDGAKFVDKLGFVRTAASTIGVTDPGITFTLIGTSSSGTTGSNVTLGEIANYRMRVTFPEISIANSVFSVTTPQNLVFTPINEIVSGSVSFTGPTIGTGPTGISYNFGTITSSSSTGSSIDMNFSVLFRDDF